VTERHELRHVPDGHQCDQPGDVAALDVWRQGLARVLDAARPQPTPMGGLLASEASVQPLEPERIGGGHGLLR
jgi:hypothetical protein